MADDNRPQLYLITPPAPDAGFPDLLGRLLDSIEVACIRLAPASTDEAEIGRNADALRAVAHDRDVALVIERHIQMAERHGLDGVHLPDGARNVRAARKALGADAIVGAYCGISRHDGMNAAEAGADYVAFGPVGATALGTGEVAPEETFAWWSEVIEVPVVAEGALTAEVISTFAPITDFLAIGPEIWGAEDPIVALRHLTAGIE